MKKTVIALAAAYVVIAGSFILTHKADSVVLPCIQGATDTDVVQTGRTAVFHIKQGYTVELCGNEITLEQAIEMSEF